MKPTNKVLEWIIIAVLIAPFLYAALLWAQLPDRIVSHVDAQGNPNDTQPKAAFVGLMAGLQLLLYGLLRFVPGAGVFPNQQPETYHRLRLVVTLFMSAITGWLLYLAVHPGLSTGASPILVMVMVFLAALGNYMTNVRPNFFVGIRTPWTLFSETVWRKTHQMAGRLWVAGGVIGALLLLLVPSGWQLGVVMVIISPLSIIPVVYSFLLFRKEKQRMSHP